MVQYLDKDALVAEIISVFENSDAPIDGLRASILARLLSLIDTLEVKEVDLMIHTIIAECCDWLAMSTNLSHDEIEGCRNLMLIVKEEQFKAQKGEEL